MDWADWENTDAIWPLLPDGASGTSHDTLKGFRILGIQMIKIQRQDVPITA